MSARTHIPEHDPIACETCGGCTWSCPASVFPEQAMERDSLRGALFSTRPYPGARAQLPPCQLACPLNQDVPGYIAAIAAGDVERAATIVRTTNALPSVCGRVCVASCARACTRAAIDEGLDIRGLKRFAVEATTAAAPESVRLAAITARIAVVGAGPAGLAAAHRLLQLGLLPVVFDAAHQAGGLLVRAIPEFVLPRERVAADVDALMSMGMELRLDTRVGADVDWDELDTEYDAVLVATGAGAGRVSVTRGARLEGVFDAITFASARPALAGPLVVNGSGDAAVEIARLACRLGADPVTVVSSAPRELWPAGEHALGIAEQEGVTILGERRVLACEGDGRLQQVFVQRLDSACRDAIGRPRATGREEETLAATWFVDTTWRTVPASARPDFNRLEKGWLGVLKTQGARLPRSRWYAAGEVAFGAGTVVDSMATGRRAAAVIARDLGRSKS